jgi:rod shape-determining protein MreC
VIDNAGVVGQVTRVFPFTSEVTLLTDKEQAIPVQVLRNGLRSVAYGRGHSGLLDLRFVAPNADIQVGDVLVTSGLDGMYPAGLAVAKVIQVESVAAGSFGRVVCQPLAGIDRHRQLLIVMSTAGPAGASAGRSAPKPAASASARRNLPKMEADPAAAAAGRSRCRRRCRSRCGAGHCSCAGVPAAGAPAAGVPAAANTPAAKRPGTAHDRTGARAPASRCRPKPKEGA